MSTKFAVSESQEHDPLPPPPPSLSTPQAALAAHGFNYFDLPVKVSSPPSNVHLMV